MTLKKPTQNDVARHANVSQALVSYVLTGNTEVTIPSETRQRILAAMKELGYQPSKAARSLRTSKTHTIAGVIPDILNPFYPAFQRGIQSIADYEGYDLITYNTHANPDKERSFCESLPGRADGLIAVLFHVNAMGLLPLFERGFPVVRLEAMYKAPGGYPLDNIYMDNTAASYAAVSYLISKGHRRIGMLAGHAGPSRQRIAGYWQALNENHIPSDNSIIETAEFNETGGCVGMAALLARVPDITAVFASNDLMAIGAMQAIREAGRRVPDDIAVVGFDDIPAARLINPALTTISQHQEQIGRRAAQMLFERLNSASSFGGRSESMPFELIIRESA